LFKSKILLAAVPLIVLLAAGLVYEYGYLRIQEDLAVIREEQAAKTRTLKKALAIIAEKPELEKSLKSLRDLRQADNTKLMGGEMPSLASAALQDTIKGIVTNRGGTVSSARVGKVEDIIYQEPGTEKTALETRERKAPADKKGAKQQENGGKFKIINASLDIVVPDPAALRDILYFIETRTPYLVVREVDSRVRNMKEPRELVVRLDVAALYGG
jgi:hypothetical protein